ncbi:hypothetical protein B0H16DRAFT_1646036 [Mycena metata]|uniref:Uncharacterized protein n=1 Tax=Mycena metata TaxID=1033252 RepID=A0AAD7GJK4_9AGAR|nr:hypothetical protein B0H16DRAFT_1646036 [Mycena metata]
MQAQVKGTERAVCIVSTWMGRIRTRRAANAMQRIDLSWGRDRAVCSRPWLRENPNRTTRTRRAHVLCGANNRVVATCVRVGKPWAGRECAMRKTGASTNSGPKQLWQCSVQRKTQAKKRENVNDTYHSTSRPKGRHPSFCPRPPWGFIMRSVSSSTSDVWRGRWSGVGEQEPFLRGGRSHQWRKTRRWIGAGRAGRMRCARRLQTPSLRGWGRRRCCQWKCGRGRARAGNRDWAAVVIWLG